jgi:alcohol dehydrogenase
MAAHRFPRLFGMIETGRLDPGALVTQRLDLAGGAACLMAMADGGLADGGIAVIDRFD